MIDSCENCPVLIRSPFPKIIDQFDNDYYMPEITFMAPGLEKPLHLHRATLISTSRRMDALFHGEHNEHIAYNSKTSCVGWLYDNDGKSDEFYCDALMKWLRFSYGEDQTFEVDECAVGLLALSQLDLKCEDDCVKNEIVRFMLKAANDSMRIGSKMLMLSAAKWNVNCGCQALRNTMVQETETQTKECFVDDSVLESAVAVTLEELEQDAKEGDAEAMYQLGMCYLNGDGVVQDKKKAIEFFQCAAEKDHAESMAVLADYYIPKDQEKAISLLERALKKGSVRAIFLVLALSSFYENEMIQDEKEPIELCKEAAEKGDASAMNNLGARYCAGDGVPSDQKKGVEYFEAGSKKGNMDATYNLAQCYFEGKGVSQDLNKGIELLKLGVEKDHTPSMKKLAWYYLRGVGVEQDESKTTELFERAADKGDQSSVFFLALCKGKGDGTGVSLYERKARDLIKQAAAKGNTLAKRVWKKVNTEQTRGEVNMSSAEP